MKLLPETDSPAARQSFSEVVCSKTWWELGEGREATGILVGVAFSSRMAMAWGGIPESRARASPLVALLTCMSIPHSFVDCGKCGDRELGISPCAPWSCPCLCEGKVCHFYCQGEVLIAGRVLREPFRCLRFRTTSPLTYFLRCLEPSSLVVQPGADVGVERCS